jgi:two-component system response regulator AtoC
MSAPLEALLTSEDPIMRAVLEDAARVGERAATPVRILGEMGSGKETLARLIHESTPSRREAPFVIVSCTAAAEDTLRAEVFGDERAGLNGAGTRPGALERAAGGTLFLDDVGELPRRLQLEVMTACKTGRLRRVGGTEELAWEARVIAGTTTDLARAVRKGTFRADLFHRLEVFRLTLPPLRNRRADIAPLARWFIAQFSRQWARPPKDLSPQAVEKLLSYSYPGNVRELRNVVESALIAERGDRIGPESLVLGTGTAPEDAFFAIHLGADELPPRMAEVEKRYLERVLRFAKGNRSEVARLLGLSYPTITRKIAEYGIEVPE